MTTASDPAVSTASPSANDAERTGATPRPAAQIDGQSRDGGPPYGAPDEPPSAGPQSRATLVAAAVNRWVSELAGLNGRDPLLHYRDLKVGTLDLASADADNRTRLLDGDPVPVSRLFPHEPLRSSALRTARKIRDSARELAHEHGVEAAHLVVGIATWANPYAAHRPSVPVLLRSASVVARDPAETDFVITISEAAYVNPMLLDEMDRQLGLRFTIDDLRDPDGRLRYPGVVKRLREFAPPHVVDGFTIAHRAVLGRFAREPLAQAADVRALAADLENNDVIAALAGDSEAAASLGDGARTSHRPAGLILETDRAQRDAVAAIVGGRNLRVTAPPGTGRTQTIAAAAAELVAGGQRVLIVSPKRACLHDLKQRLASVGVGDLVADGSGRGAVEALGGRIADAVGTLSEGEAADTDTEPEPPSEATAGSTVQRYLDALHRRRDPWNASAHELMAALTVAPAEIRTATRLDGETLQHMGKGSFTALRAKISEYAQLGGLAQHSAESPWRTAHVPSQDRAESVGESVRSLRASTLPALKDMATRAAVEVGLAGPATAAEALATVDLLSGVAVTKTKFLPQLWDAPIGDYAAATAPRGRRKGAGGPIARRRLRLQVIDLLLPGAERPDRSQLHTGLVAARDQLAAWREKSRDGRPPRTGEHLPAAIAVAAAMREQLATLASVDPSADGLVELPFAEARGRLDQYADAEAELMALPRRTELQRELVEAGLNDLLTELRDGPIAPDRAADALTFTWQASLVDLWRSQDSTLRDADPAELEADLFAPGDTQGDRERAAARAHAGRARVFAELAVDHEGEVSVVESAGSGQVTVRDLVAVSPEVATAALPIWLTSPLTVPMLLPPRRLFDVVIVEDAGLVPPAYAVSALARTSRAVLVGDAEQLPPMAFVTSDAATEDLDTGPSAPPPLSLMDALGEALPSLPLSTQHRVRDDRLVRFAADTAYDGRMTLLPAAYEPPRLRHELVDPGETQPDSSEAEVTRVVELVLEHARTRPHESLGVVTLSGPHASRVETALRTALIRNPDVAPFLEESRAEPFFIKDVSRVAGDVRDAIILTLGFGRSVDGRVLYRFGALDRPGGERRLAAATTRSRERTIVVSCFGADDLSPRRLTTLGGQALREFLAYTAEPWQPAGDELKDPLADAIARRLEAAGASVVRAYGDPSGQVEIAVRHPKRQGRMVLVVETDGGRGGAQLASWRHDRLSRLGWSVHRVWSAAWSADPDREAARLVKAYKSAVAAADAFDWGGAAVEADVVAGIPNDEADEKKPSGKKGKARRPKKRGPRPHLKPGREISAYCRQELTAIAAWVERDGVPRTEDEVIAEMVAEVRPFGYSEHGDARSNDILRYAVRLSRARH